MPGRQDERHDAGSAAAQAAPSGAASRPRLPDAAVRTVAAAEILGPGGMLRIDLDGEIYTLRLTRNHRLILTK